MVTTFGGSFSFDSAVVTAGFSGLGVNLAPSAATSVTIAGLRFGYTELTPTASLDYRTSAACATTSWTSSTTVGCDGTAVWTAHKLVEPWDALFQLTVAAVAGTHCDDAAAAGVNYAGRLGLFTFDAPAVSHLHIPGNMNMGGGLSVTIEGLSFGVLAQTSSMSVSTVVCATTSWTDALRSSLLQMPCAVAYHRCLAQ